MPRFFQSLEGGCPDSANPWKVDAQILPILGRWMSRFCQSLEGGCSDSANPQIVMHTDFTNENRKASPPQKCFLNGPLVGGLSVCDIEATLTLRLRMRYLVG